MRCSGLGRQSSRCRIASGFFRRASAASTLLGRIFRRDAVESTKDGDEEVFDTIERCCFQNRSVRSKSGRRRDSSALSGFRRLDGDAL